MSREIYRTKEIINTCRDYLYPDAKLLEGLEEETDIDVLLSKYKNAKSRDGKYQLACKLSELVLHDLDSDRDLLSLQKRKELANYCANPIECANAVDNRVSFLLLDLEFEEWSIEFFESMYAIAPGGYQHTQAIDTVFKDYLQNLLEDEKDHCDDCEKVLKIHRVGKEVRDVAEEYLQQADEKFLKNLNVDTEITVLKDSFKIARSKSCKDKILEYIDITRGLLDDIDNLNYYECMYRLEFVKSAFATKVLYERICNLIVMIDPQKPPIWFLGVLQQVLLVPPDTLNVNKLIADKAQEILDIYEQAKW